MQKFVTMLFAIGGIAMIAGFFGVEPAYSQLRVPPTHVTALAALAVHPSENATEQDQDTDTWTAQPAAQVLPVQLVVSQQDKTPTTAPPKSVPPKVATQDTVPPQVPPQMQGVVPQAMPQPGMAPATMNGVIVIPVTVPQCVTYAPPPAAMMYHQPPQMMMPQQFPTPMPAPMPQYMAAPMYYPPAMPMMQQPMMMPQAPPPQPIPVKMILPDGSKVSIKHYIPGQYFKNALRAVTP